MRKGYILFEIILALALIGILAVLFFPIHTSSLVSFNRLKNLTEMTYMGEMVVESLKSSHPSSMEAIKTLENLNEVDFFHPSIDNLKYTCKLIKLDDYMGHMDIKVILGLREREVTANVEYKATIFKR